VYAHTFTAKDVCAHAELACNDLVVTSDHLDINAVLHSTLKSPLCVAVRGRSQHPPFHTVLYAYNAVCTAYRIFGNVKNWKLVQLYKSTVYARVRGHVRTCCACSNTMKRSVMSSNYKHDSYMNDSMCLDCLLGHRPADAQLLLLSDLLS
jgi:hypothetical protein